MHVAPFTGAWIETMPFNRFFQLYSVAPFTGAWIETNIIQYALRMAEVAPFTGAWIETSNMLQFDNTRQSLPSRERGLKPGTPPKEGNNPARRSLHGSVD